MNRTESIRELVKGNDTAAAIAARFGVTEAEVLAWRDLYVDGLDVHQRRRRPRRLLLSVAAAIVAATVVSGVAFAQAGVCAQTLPAPLVTFCANAPGRASDINGNFQQGYDWLAQKVGTPGSPNVDISGNATVVGSLRVDGGTTLENNLTVRGNVTVAGSMLGNYQDGPGAGGSVPSDAGTFAPDSGFAIGQDYRATSDGFLMAQMFGFPDGARCVAHLFVDGVLRARMSTHQNTSSDAHVNDASSTIPVKKGSTWRVVLFTLYPGCPPTMSWMPLAP